MIFKLLRQKFSTLLSEAQPSRVRSNLLSDRERLTKLLLEKFPIESVPVQAVLKRINEIYDKDLYYYNNLLSVFVKTRQSSHHVEDLLREMKKANIEPDNYTQHTLLFYFCINKSINRAELLAQAIKELNTTGTNLK
jgi:pentatricopeptide repeat protein